RPFAPDEIPDAPYWREQARQSGRLAEGIPTLAALGCGLLLEVGPQPDLTDLVREGLNGEAPKCLAPLRRGGGHWGGILRSLAQAAVAGARVTWGSFDRDYPRRKVSLPTSPFQRERYWVPAIFQPQAQEGRRSHPLLGTMTRSAAHHDFTFETTLSLKN